MSKIAFFIKMIGERNKGAVRLLSRQLGIDLSALQVAIPAEGGLVKGEYIICLELPNREQFWIASDEVAEGLVKKEPVMTISDYMQLREILL